MLPYSRIGVAPDFYKLLLSHLGCKKRNFVSGIQRVLLAFEHTFLISEFRFKSLVIVTPRYLMLSTFSRTVPSRVYEAWILLCLFCQLHHVVFDWLKSHYHISWPKYLNDQ